MLGPSLVCGPQRIWQGPARFTGGVEVVRELEDPLGVEALDALGGRQMQTLACRRQQALE